MIPGEIQEKLDLIPTMNLVHKIIKLDSPCTS